MTRKLVAVLGLLAVTVSCAGPRQVDSLAVPVHPAPATEPVEPSTEPAVEVGYSEWSWSWDGGVEIMADAPSDWTEVERGPGWWDLRHPTEALVLRIQVIDGGPPDEVAAAELRRLEPAQGFSLLDERALSGADGTVWEAGYEIHYGYERSGSPREATLRYLGTADRTYGAVALLTPPEQHADTLAVLDRVAASIHWTS